MKKVTPSIGVLQLRKSLGNVRCKTLENHIANEGVYYSEKGVRVTDPKLVLNRLLEVVWDKLPDNFQADPNLFANLSLVCEAGGEYSTRLDDRDMGEGIVPGLNCLTGNVTSKGRTLKLFTRFISKPFWQFVAKDATLTL